MLSKENTMLQRVLNRLFNNGTVCQFYSDRCLIRCIQCEDCHTALPFNYFVNSCMKALNASWPSFVCLKTPAYSNTRQNFALTAFCKNASTVSLLVLVLFNSFAHSWWMACSSFKTSFSNEIVSHFAKFTFETVVNRKPHYFTSNRYFLFNMLYICMRVENSIREFFCRTVVT